MMTMRECHTKSVHAEIIPIEITAACFGPAYQRLITGAHDGTLKIWNFNTGTCLRNMQIEANCEIKRINWINNRILVMGWNRRVTEFADSDEFVGTSGKFSKNWDLRHTEDISAAAVRFPQTIVTGTYDGELIMWRLETGQPYKQYNCSDPTTRIKIYYKKTKRKTEDKTKKNNKTNIINRALGKQTKTNKKVPLRKESPKETVELIKSPQARRLSTIQRLVPTSPQSQRSQLRTRRVSTVVLPEHTMPLRRLAIHCMIFLNNRTMDPKTGTLLVALENGNIQVWSHHISGGFIISFSAIHKAGDYVICMATDANNEFLFTGTSVGYIKTWLMINYCTPNPPQINMPKYRIMFPFLWGDFFAGRAARIAKSQSLPILLNSYKGHAMAVSYLDYINEAEILLR